MSPARSPVAPVAVIGVAALFPGSTTAMGYWRDIVERQDRLSEIPPEHWPIADYYDPKPGTPDKVYARRGGFISNVDFEPLEFGLPPNTVPSTDTAQLLALIMARQVLDEVTRGRGDAVSRDRISVILGVASALELTAHMARRLDIPLAEHAMRAAGISDQQVARAGEILRSSYVPWQESTFPGLLANVVAGRVSNRLDLGGTNFVVDAACAGSLAALHVALSELYLGDADVVITGGVDALNDILMFMCFAQTGALSRGGDCRPFSADADGTMLGEGVGMVALKRLDDAERDGDPVYAVIRGIGSSSDGRAKSIYAPRPAGQAMALRRAYEHAGFGAETVELVEAHGTATPAGDQAEFDALRAVFEEAGAPRRKCALGSVKSQIGHTKSAAGAASLIKTVFALHQQALPPTIKVGTPNPSMRIDESPFYLNTEARPWIRAADHPRRAAVSSFGFGGTNFHVALEEYTGANPAGRLRVLPAELVLLHAVDGQSLAAACRAAIDPASTDLGFRAYESHHGFDPSAKARIAVVASDAEDLDAKLTRAADLIERGGEAPFSTPSGIHVGFGALEGQTAALFPGQGSQYVGMGNDVALHFDVARSVWDRAAGLDLGGEHLHDRVFPPPAFDDETRARAEADLVATEWAQPAIVAASLAAFALLRSVGYSADGFGGHSLGEVTALAAAGGLSEIDALRVARRRGELMAAAGETPGAMLAVASDAARVRALLARSPGELVLANHNSPTQCVVSGTLSAIDAFESLMAAEGLRGRRLSVSTAFHSPIVSPACGSFGAFLQSVKVVAPTSPVYANATATIYPSDAAAIRTQLTQQIAEPVRFVEQIEAMYAAGIRTFVEIGPDSVLTRLVQACLEGRPHRAVATDQRGKPGVAALFDAIGRLVAAGVQLDLRTLWKGQRVPADPRARKRGKLVLEITGANYGKPLPLESRGACPPSAQIDSAGSSHGAVSMSVAAAQVTAPGSNAAAPQSPVASPAASAQGTSPSAPSVAPPNPSSEIPTPVSATARPVPAATRGNPTVSSSRIDALQQLHAPLIAAQVEYQRVLAESHLAFLRVIEASYAPLGLVPGLAPERTEPAHVPSSQAPSVAMPEMYTTTVPAVPVAPPPVSWAPLPSPHAPSRAPLSEHPAPAAVRPVAAAPASGATDMVALLLDVVAQKTGYPADMLDLGMGLEADLGIDSIKRVEILSAVRTRVPDLPDFDTGRMASLRTLGEIVAYLGEKLGVPATAATAPVAAASAVVAPIALMPTSAAADMATLLLDVVAQKTGYPADMLDLGMALDADLGIDSIKRVEILSAVRTRVPDLPDFDTGRMASLRTLGEIVAYLGEKLGVPAETDLGHAPGVGTANGPATAAPHTVPAIGRYTVSAVSAPAAGLAMPGFQNDEPVVVAPSDGAYAVAIAKALRARGVNARAGQADSASRTLVYVGGLADVGDIDAAIATNRAAFEAARAVAARFRQGPGTFVTVQDTGGDFGLSGRAETRAWTAGIGALAKSAAEEWPQTAVKALDVERGGRSFDDVAEVVCTELLSGGPEIEVGLRADGSRWTVTATPGELPGLPAKAPVAGQVIVVTGGARGVTAHAVMALARASRPRLVLLGRSVLEDEPPQFHGLTDEAQLKRAALDASRSDSQSATPREINVQIARVLANREIRQTLAAVRAAGSEVRYEAIDVRDASALDEVLDRTRREWGPIAGIVHAAGVLADAWLDQKTLEQFDKVFDTKVAGLRALLDATRHDPITWLCVFSSVAARVGNPGQSDYAMANEVMNKVAAAEARRRGPGCRVKAFGFGPWAGGMVNPALEQHFTSRGVGLIPLDSGAQAFVNETLGTDPTVEIVLGVGAMLATRRAEQRMDVVVDAHRWPQLDGHRVQGVPVLPVVAGIEWFARIAPPTGAHAWHLHDLRVVRGVRLDEFDTRPMPLAVVRYAESSGGTKVELRDAGGAVRMAGRVGNGSTPARVTPSLLGGAPWNGREIYGPRALFHGPAFQVLRTIESMSDDGARAKIAGTTAVAWPDGPWRTDPAAIDGVLQLGSLWAQRRLGAQVLPMRIGEVVLPPRVTPPPSGGETHVCELRGRSAQGQSAVFDADLVAPDGTVVAMLRGVEVYAAPGGTAGGA